MPRSMNLTSKQREKPATTQTSSWPFVSPPVTDTYNEWYIFIPNVCWKNPPKKEKNVSIKVRVADETNRFDLRQWPARGNHIYRRNGAENYISWMGRPERAGGVGSNGNNK